MSNDEQNREDASAKVKECEQYVVICVTRDEDVDKDITKIFHYNNDGADNGSILRIVGTYLAQLIYQYNEHSGTALAADTDTMLNSLKDKVFDSIESININGSVNSDE